MRVTPPARQPASELAVWHERVRDGISRWASWRGQVRRQALRRRLSHQIRVVRAAIEQLEGADLTQVWLDHLGRLVKHVDQLFHELHDPGLHPQLMRWIQTRMAYVKFQRGAVGRGLEPDWSFAST